MKVLVINARGLHLGYLSAYGNEWIETPGIDRLAAEGVVFDNHIADQPDAAGACRAWRSGHYAFPPGGTEPAHSVPDLVRLLKDTGAVTSLILDTGRPAPAEFAEGWDVVMEAEPDEQGTALEYALEGVGQALESLSETDNWLLWLEVGTLLPPWDVPDEYLQRYLAEPGDDDEEPEALEPLLDPPAGLIDGKDDLTFIRLQRTYAGAVGFLDAALEALIKELEERKLLDDVLLILTADHGLPLGEHSVVGLGRPWLHDELTHIPLIMRLPKREKAGRRVPALTQPVDLMPTLLEAFGQSPVAVHGHSLWPLLRGTAAKVRDYACSGLYVGKSVEWALRSPDWAFLLPLHEATRTAQLYAKPDDRWELNNVLQHHPALAERLEAVLRGFVAATRHAGSLRPPELLDVEAGPAAGTTEARS
jgi:arylsulfatase A-like enzyme